MLITIWILTGILAYGLSFATMQRRFPSIAREGLWKDFAFCLFMSLFGPLSLVGFVIATILDGDAQFYGLKFLPRHENV